MRKARPGKTLLEAVEADLREMGSRVWRKGRTRRGRPRKIQLDTVRRLG